MSVRKATPADLDGIMETIIEALRDCPQAQYRFPYREQHPDVFEHNTKIVWEYALKDGYPDNYVLVAEAPDPDDPTTSKIAALALWDITCPNKRKFGPGYTARSHYADAMADPRNTPRIDGDQAHMDAFHHAAVAAVNEYIDAVYGDRIIHLRALATHPKFWRQGHASRLVQKGIDWARRDGLAVTLIATPMGVKLYRSMGFEKVGEKIPLVPGEEDREAVSLEVMVLDTLEADGGVDVAKGVGVGEATIEPALA